MSDSIELFIAIVIATVVSIIGLIIASIINSVQLRGRKNQLSVTNFRELTSYIDDDETRKFTSWLLDDEEKKAVFEKFKKEYGLDYDKKEYADEIKEIEKAVWYLAFRYNRLGFMLDQDAGTEEKILDYHGKVITKLWLVLEPIINMRENIEKDNAHKYFRKIGRKAVSDSYSSRKLGMFDKNYIRLTAIAVVVSAFITIFYNLFDIWLTPIFPADYQAGMETTTAGVLAIVVGLIMYKVYTKSLKLS